MKSTTRSSLAPSRFVTLAFTQSLDSRHITKSFVRMALFMWYQTCGTALEWGTVGDSRRCQWLAVSQCRGQAAPVIFQHTAMLQAHFMRSILVALSTSHFIGYCQIASWVVGILSIIAVRRALGSPAQGQDDAKCSEH
jgi:hypothetical protein